MKETAKASAPLSSTSQRDAATNPAFVEFNKRVAIGGHALGHLQTPRPWNDHGRQFKEQVVEIVAGFAPDLDCVSKSGGRDEADRCASPLDDGVGDQRGAVDDAVQIGGVQPRLGAPDNHLKVRARRALAMPTGSTARSARGDLMMVGFYKG